MNDKFRVAYHFFTKLECIYAFCASKPERLQLLPANPTEEEITEMFLRCATSAGMESLLWFVEVENQQVEECHSFIPNSFSASSKEEAESLVYLRHQRHQHH